MLITCTCMCTCVHVYLNCFLYHNFSVVDDSSNISVDWKEISKKVIYLHNYYIHYLIRLHDYRLLNIYLLTPRAYLLTPLVHLLTHE